MLSALDTFAIYGVRVKLVRVNLNFNILSAHLLKPFNPTILAKFALWFALNLGNLGDSGMEWRKRQVGSFG